MKDAPFMLEWIHDDAIVHCLRKDFAAKTIQDCREFIFRAADESESIHLAIVNDKDEYMGTVSLKHIRQNTAEFAIVLRGCAMGRGYASFAMKEIFDYGYRVRRINFIYWCTDPENRRSVRFYEKCGFQRCDIPEQAKGYTEAERQAYIWYSVKMTSSPAETGRMYEREI